jgi:hypothetical protein
MGDRRIWMGLLAAWFAMGFVFTKSRFWLLECVWMNGGSRCVYVSGRVPFDLAVGNLAPMENANADVETVRTRVGGKVVTLPGASPGKIEAAAKGGSLSLESGCPVGPGIVLLWPLVLLGLAMGCARPAVRPGLEPRSHILERK